MKTLIHNVTSSFHRGYSARPGTSDTLALFRVVKPLYYFFFFLTLKKQNQESCLEIPVQQLLQDKLSD